jgi:hypothetical protein
MSASELPLGKPNQEEEVLRIFFGVLIKGRVRRYRAEVNAAVYNILRFSSGFFHLTTTNSVATHLSGA